MLKMSVAALVELNMLKNLTCTAVAGSLGGFSADGRNIGFNVFIATCQDPTQNVESSRCITVMEAINGKYIHISITTPSIERNARRVGKPMQPTTCLTTRLDKLVRNRVTSLRKKNGVKYEKAMEIWFRRR
ncbi:hypothetical protein Bca4012_085162 [Brassica carinata]